MLKAMGALLKLALFSIVILLAGQWISWDGRTLSQHVQAQVTHAERSDTAAYVRGLARRVTEDARSGFEKTLKDRSMLHPGTGLLPAPAHASRAKALAPSVSPPASEDDGEITDRTEIQSAAPEKPLDRQPAKQGEMRTVAHTEEQIPPSERQKLRALIRELNSTTD